jgi:hypothetical protein
MKDVCVIFWGSGIAWGGIAWAENFGLAIEPKISAEHQPKISGSKFEPENFGWILPDIFG